MFVLNDDYPDTIKYDELATLRNLAANGAFVDEVKVSCEELAGELGVSRQTVSRRLSRLDSEGFLDRNVGGDDIVVQTTVEGNQLLKSEYKQYRRILEQVSDLAVHGTVCSGRGEGEYYVSLEGYMEQFRRNLGFESYLGTLNVKLEPEEVGRNRPSRSLPPSGLRRVTMEAKRPEPRGTILRESPVATTLTTVLT